MIARPSQLVHTILGCAIRVHRRVGPGLLESAYADCLAEELRRVGVPFERQVVVSLDYDEVHLDRVYRADFVVSREVLLEIKSVDRLAPVHTSQVVTYLKLLQLEHGIILNFNVRRMKDGIRSVLLTRDRHETTERQRDKRG